MTKSKVAKALLLLACGMAGSSAISQVGKGEEITRSQFGADWPFTVEKGKVHCYQGRVTFESNGTIYAINGLAMTEARHGNGWKDVAPIWLPNPKIPGTKIGIGDIIKKGQSLCK